MSARFLLFALDSADPDLLLEWSADGTLPVLAGLRTRGAHARLAGPETVSPHGVWSSIWSGLSMGQHGRYLRRPLRPGTYELAHADHPLELAPPFWGELGERKIAILDAPDALPIPGLRGPQLLGWGTHPSPAAARSEPASLAGAIERHLGPRIVSDETQGTRARDRRVLGELLRRVRQQGTVARQLLTGCDGGVVGFGDPHAAGHRFWKYGPAAATRVEAPSLSRALQDVYAAVDEEIGRIIAALPGDTHVAVISNHGITEGYPTEELMRAFCVRLGYQVNRGQSTLAAGRRVLETNWRRAAAVLRRRGARLEDDLRWVDWDRTTVFAIPGLYTGFLRVNLRGREPRGTVDPADYAAVLDRVEADLRVVVNGVTGEPAVERITRSAEAFGGGVPHWLPDLFVEWRLATSPLVRHPRATLQGHRLGLTRTNHHSRTGLVFVAGPAVQARGDAGELSPTDLTPLFRCFAGAPSADWTRPAMRAFQVTEAS